MDAQDIRNLQEAYLEVYERDLNESLADMFSSASAELNKRAEKHLSDAQERLRNLNAKLEKTYGKPKPIKSSSKMSSLDRVKAIEKKIDDELQRDNERNESYDHLFDEERSDISYARSAVSNARKRYKQYPEGHKGDSTKHEYDLSKKAFKNLVSQERDKRKTRKESYYEIVDEEFKDLTPEKEKRVTNRVGELARDLQVSAARMKELRKKPFAKYRPNVSREAQGIVKSARKKQKLVQNASDALIRTSISRSAALEKRRQELKDKMNEQVDIYDIILSHLLDEGYAETIENAEAIMVSMSEEWREEILSEMPYQIYGPAPHGPSDSEPVKIGKPYKNKKRARTRADKLDQEIGGYRHSVRYVPEQ